MRKTRDTGIERSRLVDHVQCCHSWTNIGIKVTAIFNTDTCKQVVPSRPKWIILSYLLVLLINYTANQNNKCTERRIVCENCRVNSLGRMECAAYRSTKFIFRLYSEKIFSTILPQCRAGISENFHLQKDSIRRSYFFQIFNCVSRIGSSAFFSFYLGIHTVDK